MKIVLNICSLVHTYALASRLLSKCMLLVFSLSLSSISQWNMRWFFVWSPWVQTHSGDWIVLKRCRCAFVFPCAVTIADIYLLLNYSSCFGRPSRPSSGVHKTIVAASGTDHTIWGASFFKRDLNVTFEEAFVEKIEIICIQKLLFASKIMPLMR